VTHANQGMKRGIALGNSALRRGLFHLYAVDAELNVDVAARGVRLTFISSSVIKFVRL
jgi:hypothetical protein